MAKFGESEFYGDTDHKGNNIDNVSVLDAKTLRGNIYGIRWNITEESWERIDRDGNALSVNRAFFDNKYPWGGIRRVNLQPDGEITGWWDGTNQTDNYSNDGSNGRVMVEYPATFSKIDAYTLSGDKIIEKYISDKAQAGFEIFPSFYPGGGKPAKSHIYLGAYEASFNWNGQYELFSRSGRQPWTGGEIWEIDIDNLTNEPSVGDTITTSSESSDVIVVDVDWGNGTLWGRLVNDDSLDFTDNETITNTTQGGETVADCEFSTGSKTALRLDIEEAREYANNIGSGWQLQNYYDWALRQILFSIEYGNMDSQSELGRGIVDLSWESYFAGKLTGADSIDAQLTAALTGTGTGADGETPICWRGLENPWGNTWKFADGLAVVDSEYRILLPDGEWSKAGEAGWTTDDYQAITMTPLTDDDGYIDDVETEQALRYGFVPASSAGSSSSHIPDYVYSHDSGETNILLLGGHWSYGSGAGLGNVHLYHDAGNSNLIIASRSKFVG